VEPLSVLNTVWMSAVEERFSRTTPAETKLVARRKRGAKRREANIVVE
jgi:hypothetical protein